MILGHLEKIMGQMGRYVGARHPQYSYIGHNLSDAVPFRSIRIRKQKLWFSR